MFSRTPLWCLYVVCLLCLVVDALSTDIKDAQTDSLQVNIDVNLTANDDVTFYADGVLVGYHDGYPESVAAHYTIPLLTKVLAAKSVNAVGLGGFVASLNTGEVTGSDWKCTHLEYPGWTDVTYDDSSWPNSHLIGKLNDPISFAFPPPDDIDPDAYWIWTDGWQGDHMTSYCRKYRQFVDPCDSSPCMNGGHCVTVGNGIELTYRCKCLPIYSGERCSGVVVKQISSLDCGGTCTVSSTHSEEYVCENAIDGSLLPGPNSAWASMGEGVGAWIQIDFGSYYQVMCIMFLPRCRLIDHARSVEVSMSGRPSQQLELYCLPEALEPPCAENFWQIFDLTPTISDFARVTVKELCTSNVANFGFIEMRVYGHDAPMVDVASLARGATCTSSSEVDGYGCEGAIDDDEGPDPGHEWGSDSEGNGAWIQINLNGTHTIFSVGLLQRCDQIEQNKIVRLDFSDGTTQHVELVCFNTGQSPSECDGQYWQRFTLQPAVVISWVKLEISLVCTTRHNGFREINLLTIKDWA